MGPKVGFFVHRLHLSLPVSAKKILTCQFLWLWFCTDFFSHIIFWSMFQKFRTSSLQAATYTRAENWDRRQVYSKKACLFLALQYSHEEKLQISPIRNQHREPNEEQIGSNAFKLYYSAHLSFFSSVVISRSPLWITCFQPPTWLLLVPKDMMVPCFNPRKSFSSR